MHCLGDLRSVLEADEQAVFIQYLDVADQLSDREFIKVCECTAGLVQHHIQFIQPFFEGCRAPLFLFQLRFFCHETGLGHVDLLELLIIVGAVGAGADDQLEQLQLALL